MIKTWHNGASGGEVKEIIEQNFNVVSKYLSREIRALSTQERNLLGSDYLSEGVIVYDTTEKEWFKYAKGVWVEFPIAKTYIQAFSKGDWIDNKIQIGFNQHRVLNPTVQLFIVNDGSLTPVVGGVSIDSEFNILLSTDLPFDGKVVVK